MQIRQVTAWGEEHGLIATYPNAVPNNDFQYADPSIKESLKKLKKEDSKLVKVRYINHLEKSRGRFKQPYCKYAGEAIQQYNLIHDHEYTLPLGLVKDVNAMRMPIREGLQSVDGKDVKGGSPLTRDSEDRIHEFVNTSF